LKTEGDYRVKTEMKKLPSNDVESSALVGCPICGEPRSEFQRGKTMTGHGDYVGVEACDWCGTTFFSSTLDGEIERSPKEPNVTGEPEGVSR